MYAIPVYLKKKSSASPVGILIAFKTYPYRHQSIQIEPSVLN